MRDQSRHATEQEQGVRGVRRPSHIRTRGTEGAVHVERDGLSFRLGELLRHRFGERIQRFVESGRPVLGICNGFQTLVKAGLLPGR